MDVDITTAVYKGATVMVKRGAGELVEATLPAPGARVSPEYSKPGDIPSATYQSVPDKLN